MFLCFFLTQFSNLQVKANGRASLTFTVDSKRAGTARFQLIALSQGHADASEIEVPVSNVLLFLMAFALCGFVSCACVFAYACVDVCVCVRLHEESVCMYGISWRGLEISCVC